MAIRINKVYTRSGDDGTTALIGGIRVAKDHLRVEAYGCVDELNSVVGLCRSFLSGREKKEMDSTFKEIQNRLFDLGSVLATPDGRSWKDMPLPGAESVSALERSMDAMQKSLKPLNSFVLPGGSPSNAWLHLCRTVCRRAERRVSALMRAEKSPPEVLRYLNRLSDWFFVAARYVALRSGKPEYLWEFPTRSLIASTTLKSERRKASSILERRKRKPRPVT